MRRRMMQGMAGLASLVLTPPIALATVGPVMAASLAPAWSVDKASSHLRFQSSVGGAPFAGSFERWRADIRFDPNNLGGSSVMVRVDTASARTGASERDQALPTADWFSTARFAQAVYVAKSFKSLDGGRYQALGALTLRGVTRPLVVSFQLAIKSGEARMTGTSMIDRHVFGVGQGQFAGADTVPFAVRLDIGIVARRV